MSGQTPPKTKWTYGDLSFSIKRGSISAKTAIYHAVFILARNLNSTGFLTFAMWFKRTLPLVDWNDGKTVFGGYITWNSLEDCLAHIDTKTGYLLEIASWFKTHINDPDAEFDKAAEDKSKKLAFSENPASEAQKGRREREREGQKLNLANVSSPQMDRAQKNGISRASQKTLDKIAKVAPGYLPRIEAKEITINRAAVELGIVKVKSPLDAMKSAYGKLSDDDKAAFVAWIQAGDEPPCEWTDEDLMD